MIVRWLFCFAMAGVFLAATGSLWAGPANEMEALFKHRVEPFFQKHCIGCHNDEDLEGDFSLTNVTAAIKTKEEAQRWLDISRAVSLGDMPPEEEPRLDVAELSHVVDWIGQSLRVAQRQFAGHGRQVVMRRLGRYEYENTLRDLFQLPELTVADLIPEDTKQHVFDNNGLVLDIGNAHLDGYLDAIDVAIAKAGAWDGRSGRLRNNPYAEETKVYGLIPQELDEQAYNENLARHGRLSDIAPLPHARRTSYHSSYVFKPKTEGTYRIRLKHYLHELDERFGDVVVKDRSSTAKVKSRVVDVFRVKPGSPESAQEYEREIYLTATQSVAITVSSPPRTVGLPGWYQRFKNPKDAKAFFEKGRPDDEYQQALKIIEENKKLGCWAIMSEETEGPLEYKDQWPPESHLDLYGDKPERNAVIGDDVLAALSRFIPRAFRRPVDAEEMAPYLDLVRNEIRQHKTPPYRALEVGLRAVLTSPGVLYLQEKEGNLEQYALASRLSYFLWSTPPDEALLTEARAGKLKGEGLTNTVERMLNEPKSQALEERFLTLWLDLDKIDDTNPDAVLYPEFTETIKQLMLQETKLFFRCMLQEDLSVLNVVDSDFAMLSEELARYYGIDGVEGYEFRKVALKPDDHRGGIITQGSVLKVTANGTESSPVLRGVWLLDRIFGTPVPPPPVAPPAITPDTRGAVTVREQLAKHRAVQSCNACHRKIDPLGFALESYDPAGSFRTFYRTTGEAGKPVKAAVFRSLRDERTLGVKYKQGRDVEIGGQFPDGATFRDITEFKRLLVKQEAVVAENVVRQLLTYALGRELDFADNDAVEEILQAVEPGGYGLRSIVHQITQSQPFQTK